LLGYIRYRNDFLILDSIAHFLDEIPALSKVSVPYIPIAKARGLTARKLRHILKGRSIFLYEV